MDERHENANGTSEAESTTEPADTGPDPEVNSDLELAPGIENAADHDLGGDRNQDGEGGPNGPAKHAASPSEPADLVQTHIQRDSGWRTLLRAGRFRFSATHILVGALCALLGFAVVVQMRHTRDESLSSLRQTDLVRLLDEVTQRSDQLEERARELRGSRRELQSGSRDDEAAIEVARNRAMTQGILAGRLPAEGPGIKITIATGEAEIRPSTMLTILEELRNAGAEAVEINDVRIIASSHFVDSARGIVLDGLTLEPPYRWTAIGNPETLTPALEIPGGAMASVRTAGATGMIDGFDEVRIDAVREPGQSSFAQPIPPDGDS